VIDVILVVVLLGYAVSGFRQGLVVGVLSLGGFVGGALVAMWAFPVIAAGMDPGLQRSVLVLFAVLVMAWLGQFLGALVGGRVRDRITHQPAARVDQVLGAVAGLLSVALVMWFVGGAIRGGPSPSLSRAVASSRVLNAIDAVAPDALVSLADTFRSVVGGTSFPRVFSGVGPESISPISPPDTAAIDERAIRAVRDGIVKITGEATACGRGQEGSGAVVARERVVTNAHVVAGVRRPNVQISGTGRRYQASVVAFDPRRDLAVLAVPGLPSAPLDYGEALQRGDDAVIAGFPRNGPFLASAARVRSVLRATGEDIYGDAGAVREVYSLYARVEPGNSGGPVLTPDGDLVGVVFAKSLDDANTGYALTLAEAEPVIQAGITARRAVGTGDCAAG
jgi:S1-C subfamily serine protease